MIFNSVYTLTIDVKVPEWFKGTWEIFLNTTCRNMCLLTQLFCMLHHVRVCYQRIQVFYCKESLDDICVGQMRVLKTTFAELTTQMKILSGSIKEFLLWLSIQIHLSKQIYLSAVTFRCKCDRMHVHVVFLYIIFKCRTAIGNCFVKNM